MLAVQKLIVILLNYVTYHNGTFFLWILYKLTLLDFIFDKTMCHWLPESFSKGWGKKNLTK